VLIVDTGPLVAIADTDDRNHHACLELLETTTGPLVTTALVIAEAGYLLTRNLGPHAEIALIEMIRDTTLTIEALTATDWDRVAVLLDRYRNLPLGVTDASVIAVAERLGCVEVASLDRRHFRTVRPAHTSALVLLPAVIDPPG
jgi:hypothetical protein